MPEGPSPGAESQLDLDPAQRLAQLNESFEALASSGSPDSEQIDALSGQYVELIRSLDKKDPLKQEVVKKMTALRAMKPKVVEEQPTAEEAAQLEVHEDFNNEALIPATDRIAFESVVARFSAACQVGEPAGGQEARVKFCVAIAQKFNKRQQEILKSRDQASTVTALRGAAFELSRLSLIMDQGLEEVDFSFEEKDPSVTFEGFPKKNPDFLSPPTHHFKDSPIESDVPISRDGELYVYESKSYPRLQYGATSQTRNQALKYQAAIDQGVATGATIEVTGRVDTAFLSWAMGEQVGDPGAIPAVEIVYTMPLPSGREYRFVLKRGMGSADSGIENAGLRFQNDGKYNEADQAVITGLEHSLADKSIIGLMRETAISDEAAEQEYEEFFADVELESDEDLQAALERLFGYSRQDKERAAKTLRGFFGEKKKKEYSDDEILDKLSESLGYDVRQNKQQALKDIWGQMFEDPSKMSASAVFDAYDGLRRQSLFKAFTEKSEDLLINADNRKSAVSEYATPEYVESEIMALMDFFRNNPDIAAIKKHYVIPLERVPEAVAQVMKMVERIADFERGRAAGSEEESRAVHRTELGWAGRPEGVALDLEHIIADVVYSMNKQGVAKDRAESIFAGQEDNLSLFFEEGGDPRKLISKFKTVDELEAAIDADPALKQIFDGMSKKKKGKLTTIIGESGFVRSYDQPGRFVEIEGFMQDLPEQDRRYREIYILDPTVDGDDGVAKQTIPSDEELAKAEMRIVRENVDRAKEFLAETGRGGSYRKVIEHLHGEIDRVKAERDEKMETVKREAQQKSHGLIEQTNALKAEKKRLSKQTKGGTDTSQPELVQRLGEVTEEMSRLGKERGQAFAAVGEISEEYQPLIKNLHDHLEATYRQAVPNDEWDTFAKRIVKRVDQNIIKVIFAVKASGEVIVQEEVIRGDVTGRAAHSELAEGYNVYGAGELVFEKRGEAWVISEINSGSGHYRPDADSILTYIKNLLAEKDIDVSEAVLIDSVMRGRKLREASLF